MIELARAENRKTITKAEAEQIREEAATNAGKIAVRNAETEKVKADTDALLDEIDEILGTELQARQMVEGYVQKGGE